jgi:DNA-binding winged helix-turn-helix (wHTH) protein
LSPVNGSGGGEVRLEPRLMDLLLLFAGSAGRVLGKAEIIDGVWGGRAVGDDTLAAAVSRLRKALGHTAKRKYIETLPKRGYRLAIAREVVADAPAPRAKASSDDVEALIAQGQAALKVPLATNLAQAQLFFEAAAKGDPGSAAAQAGLAETLLMQSFAGLGPAATLLAAAKGAARAAITLDSNLPQGWGCLGAATLLADRDLEAVDLALSRAISLDLGYGFARRQRAFALAVAGKFPEAEREARVAVDLEPYSLIARSVLLRVLTLARRYRAVIMEARKVIDAAPQASEAWAAKGWAHYFLGETREAVDALMESLRAWGMDEATLRDLRQAERDGGFEALCAAGADLFQTQRVVFTPRPLDIAMLRAGAGQTDEAFAALEAAAEKNDPFLMALPWLPHLERLKNDHRWSALLERVRLPR